MVVVDSSALIPLARVGRLDLVDAVFDECKTVAAVRDEVLVDGKPGQARLEEFLDGATIEPAPDDAARIADLEGIAETDAAVILLAEGSDEVLLANDRALITVAETHGVDSWWMTTLLLKCAKEDILSGDTAADILYDLVDHGMNLDPQVYARVQRKLEEFDG